MPANRSVELERFFEGSNTGGHKFKFIEKTEKIREKAAGEVKEEAVEAQKAEVEKGKEKKPWYRW